MLASSSLCYGLLLSPPLAHRLLFTRRIRMCSDDDVARSFAKEVRRRQGDSDARQPMNEPAVTEQQPFDGVREIVLDREGNPMSIPKRPAPPPASTDDVQAIVTSLFALGVLLSLGSAVLLFAIAVADAGA